MPKLRRATTYVSVPTKAIFHLSPAPFRLLCYMLSMRDDWKFNTTHLARTFDVNKCTVSTWVKELRKERYLTIEKLPTGYTEWTISDYRQRKTSEPCTAKPV